MSTDETQERSKRILELLKESEDDLSVSEIADKLNLNRSTVSITIRTLEEVGFIKKNRKIGKSWLYTISEKYE